MSFDVIAELTFGVAGMICGILGLYYVVQHRKQDKQEKRDDRQDAESDKYMEAIRDAQVEIAVLKTMMETISVKMDKHNNFMERLAIVETKADSMNKKIEDLYRKVG